MTEAVVTPETAAPIDPKLINELFEMDPLKYTDQDIDKIIQFFRDGRQAYLQAPVEKAKKASKAKDPTIPLGQIDLSELGL